MINFKPITNVNNINDTNGVGSLEYEFYMSEYPITNELYCEFLNDMSVNYNNHYIYKYETLLNKDQGIKYLNKNKQIIYQLKPHFHNKPAIYLTYNDALIFINWLNNNFTSIDHNYNTGSQYWIPTYDEWYKAAYFDGNKYYDFPYCNNITEISLDIHKYSFSCNYLLDKVSNIGLFKLNRSCYGVADLAGNIYEYVKYNDSIKCIICGGSWNRNFMNAHKNTKRFIDKKVYTNYIGMRICKRVPSRIFKIAIYNNFGDGWKNDYINILDNHGSYIKKNITLEHGYGPKFIEFTLFSQNMIIIEYISHRNCFFENNYEIFDHNMNKIYISKPINSNTDKQIIVLKHV